MSQQQSDEAYANMLLGEQGGVGQVEVLPSYVGYSPRVQPYQVGAPVERVPQGVGEKPVKYEDDPWIAGNVSYIGFGRVAVNAGVVNQQIPIAVLRPFTIQILHFPSTVVGLILNEVQFEGNNILSNNTGIDFEAFSEVSTIPQIRWPTIDQATGITFVVSNLTGGNLFFQGGAYGATLRR